VDPYRQKWVVHAEKAKGGGEAGNSGETKKKKENGTGSRAKELKNAAAGRAGKKKL